MVWERSRLGIGGSWMQGQPLRIAWGPVLCKVSSAACSSQDTPGAGVCGAASCVQAVLLQNGFEKCLRAYQLSQADIVLYQPTQQTDQIRSIPLHKGCCFKSFWLQEILPTKCKGLLNPKLRANILNQQQDVVQNGSNAKKCSADFRECWHDVQFTFSDTSRPSPVAALMPKERV